MRLQSDGPAIGRMAVGVRSLGDEAEARVGYPLHGLLGLVKISGFNNSRVTREIRDLYLDECDKCLDRPAYSQYT
jgi:hypothetical protein